MDSQLAYSRLRVPELRHLLSQRGLETEGLKSALLLRLQMHDNVGTAASKLAALEATCSGDGAPEEVKHGSVLELQQDDDARGALAGTNGNNAVAVSGAHGDKTEIASVVNGALPTQQPPLIRKRPTATKSAPAKAAAAAAALSSTDSLVPDLTEDERALQGLLEFAVYSGFSTPGQQAPLSLKYKDFISSAYSTLFAGEMSAKAAGASGSSALLTTATSVAVQPLALGALIKAQQPPPVPRLLSKSAPVVSSTPPSAVLKSPPPPQMIPAPSAAAAVRGASSKIRPQAVVKTVAGATVKPAGIPGSLRATEVPGAAVPRKRPSEAPDILAGGDILRRKSEQVVDAHIAVGRLFSRRQALAAQLEAAREAAERKSAECEKMREHLGAMLAAEETCRERLQARTLLRMGCWQASFVVASSSPELNA